MLRSRFLFLVFSQVRKFLWAASAPSPPQLSDWSPTRQERVGDAKRRLRDDHRVSLVGLGVAGEEPGPVRRESRQVRRRHPGRPGAGEREGAYVARLVDDHERVGGSGRTASRVVLPVRATGCSTAPRAISSRDACPVGRFPDIEPDDGFRHSRWCHGVILQSVGRRNPSCDTPLPPALAPGSFLSVVRSGERPGGNTPGPLRAGADGHPEAPDRRPLGACPYRRQCAECSPSKLIGGPLQTVMGGRGFV